jgi:hypothetical protein
MQLNTFYTLRDWLLANTQLKHSKHIAVEEKLLIFLHITTRPASNRDTQERFSHSAYTISLRFHEVLDALLLLYPHFVTLPNIDTPLASRILDDFKYFPYFEDCLGALDGTHISIHVPLENQA